MTDPNKIERWRQLRDNWDSVSEGMTLTEVEQIMGFRFRLDSENNAGRMSLLASYGTLLTLLSCGR